MSDTTPRDFIDKIDGAIARGEAFMLVAVLATMIGLATLQLILRKFFSSGFEWADVVVRQMVLWVGFIGGAHATYLGRHIAIDAVSKLLGPKRAAWLRVFNCIIAAVVTGILLVVSYNYVLAERGEFFSALGTEDSEAGSIESWPFDTIMPFAFAAIVFHFVVAAKNHLLVAIGKREAPAEEVEA
ncbi:MAG: TRAP transporter small permease [Deltaproteobacteria bacterium]